VNERRPGEPAKRLSPDPELEALIQRLNTSATDAAPPGAETAGAVGAGQPEPPPAAPHRAQRWALPPQAEEGRDWLHQLLASARASHASDLLLVAGAPPTARVNGRLAPIDERALTPSATGALCAALAPERLRGALESDGTADFALTRPGQGRFRCNVHRARGQWAASIRLLPGEVPDLEALHLPPALGRFAELDYGLLLVTGPTGSGKSTTLAALLRRILARRRAHVITIEDPVEYAAGHDGSVVEHVEIGRDAPSFAAALRSALRQDPDVLLVGEMRDAESIGIAITAAETGHLVLSTLHTGDGPQTVHRILDSYPARQMEQVRVQLSISLAGVVSQQLLPRRDGQGRVPAVEILVATHAVRNLIRQGKIAHIRSQITLEKQAGMLDLDLSLARLVREGLVDAAEARARARVPDEFDRLLPR
jgi:twitching motility protein PilT